MKLRDTVRMRPIIPHPAPPTHKFIVERYYSVQGFEEALNVREAKGIFLHSWKTVGNDSGVIAIWEQYV